jgi:hypothetical protein
MADFASKLWKHLRRLLPADPGRFAAGSAISDPFGLLAAEEECRAGRHDGAGPEADDRDPDRRRQAQRRAGCWRDTRSWTTSSGVPPGVPTDAMGSPGTRS